MPHQEDKIWIPPQCISLVYGKGLLLYIVFSFLVLHAWIAFQLLRNPICIQSNNDNNHNNNKKKKKKKDKKEK